MQEYVRGKKRGNKKDGLIHFLAKFTLSNIRKFNKICHLATKKWDVSLFIYCGKKSQQPVKTS
jgi:hypothetical protein